MRAEDYWSGPERDEPPRARYDAGRPRSPAPAPAAVPWLISTANQAEQSERALQDDAHFPHVNSVLESAGWEPTSMWASRGLGTASIGPEPIDPSSELDGFVLTLQSGPMEDLAETGWAPL